MAHFIQNLASCCHSFEFETPHRDERQMTEELGNIQMAMDIDGRNTGVKVVMQNIARNMVQYKQFTSDLASVNAQ